MLTLGQPLGRHPAVIVTPLKTALAANADPPASLHLNRSFIRGTKVGSNGDLSTYVLALTGPTNGP